MHQKGGDNNAYLTVKRKLRQLLRQGGTRRNTRVSEFVLCFALFAVFVRPGSAARIVRSGVWWCLAVLGIIATAEDQCITCGLSARRQRKHNLAVLYYFCAVFTLLKRWVFIHMDRMSSIDMYNNDVGQESALSL